MASMMSGMSGMTGMGMDSSSGGMFLAHNQLLARTYWYIIAAMVGFACFLRSLRAIDISYRSVPRIIMFRSLKPSDVRCLT